MDIVEITSKEATTQKVRLKLFKSDNVISFEKKLFVLKKNSAVQACH